jgi:hypothetical protein
VAAQQQVLRVDEKHDVESKEPNMWGPLKKNREDCSRFRESLEGDTLTAVLPSTLREHAAECAQCRAIAEEVLASRELLKALPPSQAETPRPWFAQRVMAAIAARELELRQSIEAWTAVPKLAARLTWAGAAALLLASTWLYERPRPVPKSGADAAAESLFDLPSSSSSQDDVLVSRLELGR